MSVILSTTPRIFSMLPTRTKPAAAVLLGAVAQGIKSPLHQGIPFRLSNARFRQGLAASHVSYAAGLSESVVRSVEDSVQLPKIDTIERIACALGVAPCWLAFGQEGDLQWAGRSQRPALRDEPPDAIPGGIVYRAMNAAVSERLKLKRDQLGLSLRQLSEAAGVSFETIRKIETGKAIPKVDTCERIAIALGVSPCWLAFGVGVSN